MTEIGRRRVGPLGPILLAAAAFALAGAPARATPFEATLSLRIDSAIGSLGSASFVATGSGSSTHSLISLPSGIFAGASSSFQSPAPCCCSVAQRRRSGCWAALGCAAAARRILARWRSALD